MMLRLRYARKKYLKKLRDFGSIKPGDSGSDPLGARETGGSTALSRVRPLFNKIRA